MDVQSARLDANGARCDTMWVSVTFCHQPPWRRETHPMTSVVMPKRCPKTSGRFSTVLELKLAPLQQHYANIPWLEAESNNMLTRGNIFGMCIRVCFTQHSSNIFVPLPCPKHEAHHISEHTATISTSCARICLHFRLQWFSSYSHDFQPF